MLLKKLIVTISFMTSMFSVAALACGDEVGVLAQCKITDPTATPLNVRSEPMGKIKQTIRNGRMVQVLEYADYNGKPWALIQDAKTHKKLGWVLREFISCVN